MTPELAQLVSLIRHGDEPAAVRYWESLAAHPERADWVLLAAWLSAPERQSATGEPSGSRAVAAPDDGVSPVVERLERFLDQLQRVRTVPGAADAVASSPAPAPDHMAEHPPESLERMLVALTNDSASATLATLSRYLERVTRAASGESEAAESPVAAPASPTAPELARLEEFLRVMVAANKVKDPAALAVEHLEGFLARLGAVARE